MTAIAPGTDIPASIDTLEKLSFWSIWTQFSYLKGQTYSEANGNAVDSGLAPKVDVSFVTAADGTVRAICRLAFEVDPAFGVNTGDKIWQAVQEFAVATIPAEYKVD